MSDYIVSARKYRPDSFETLIGQDNIAQTLKNSILRGQLAHAYLFCGPRGVGKTSTARIFAKTINCANPTAEMEPCGTCESCMSFQEGRSYCIHELDAASNNGVDDIKALMDQVQIPPQVGRYSVYIIDEVHMLSQSAFNAFLKTLEEPPAHAIFILCTTEKHKIIPTILSRCQTYDFNRISIQDIVWNLRGIASKENISIDDESLHVIAHKADGAMRDALTIFDQTVAFCGTDIHYADVVRNLNVLDYEYSFRLVDAFLAKDYATALLIFDEILNKGFNALHFISALGSHLRDLLVSRTGGLDSLLDLPDSLKARYAQQASRCSIQFIYDALGITSQCEAGYRASSNQRLHIEYALMKLSFLGGVPASEVAARPVPAAAPAPAAEPAPRPVQPAPAAPSEPVAAEAGPVVTSSEEKVAAPAPEAPVEMMLIDPEPAVHPSAHTPRKRASKTGASLSLSALISDDETMTPIELAEEPAELAPAAPQDSIPSDDFIIGKWSELVARNTQTRPRLAHTLESAKLNISEAEGYKELCFDVTNEAQKKWIEEKLLRSLENEFNGIVGTTRIRLAVGVVPDEEQAKVSYLPSEKAKELMESNPEVREFVKDLGLDTK